MADDPPTGGITFDYDPDAGAFRMTLDGQDRPSIPVLDGRLFTDWIARYARILGDLTSRLEEVETPLDWFRAHNIANDDLVDALLAYDRTGALGSRAWLEDNLTIGQVYVMLQRIARAHA